MMQSQRASQHRITTSSAISWTYRHSGLDAPLVGVVLDRERPRKLKRTPNPGMRDTRPIRLHCRPLQTEMFQTDVSSTAKPARPT